MAHTGEFELLVLLAILRLGQDAYGVTVLDELERQVRQLGLLLQTLQAFKQHSK